MEMPNNSSTPEPALNLASDSESGRFRARRITAGLTATEIERKFGHYDAPPLVHLQVVPPSSDDMQRIDVVAAELASCVHPPDDNTRAGSPGRTDAAVALPPNPALHQGPALHGALAEEIVLNGQDRGDEEENEESNSEGAEQAEQHEEEYAENPWAEDSRVDEATPPRYECSYKSFFEPIKGFPASKPAIHFREIPSLDIGPLESRLKEITQPFQPSQLYSSVTETKFVDESLRLSSFRALVDPALFSIAEKLVEHINLSDPMYKYQLLRNDVTEIVYQKGGFFRRHQDYLSLASNVIEEFSMIICITPDGVSTSGGQTVVHLSPEVSHKSSATVQRGHALVFRKDLPHEGLLVEEGEKRIVTLNLWATRKQSDDRIIHVTFKPSELLPPDQSETKSDAKSATLQALVARPQSYALSVSTVMAFPDSLLARKVSFEDANNVGHRPAIIPFLCDTTSYDEFSIVYAAYQRCRLCPAKVARHLALLRFFGLGDELLLVDLAGPEVPSRTRGIDPENLAELSADAQRVDTRRSTFDSNDQYYQPAPEPVVLTRHALTNPQPPPAAEGDVLICSSYEHARVVSDMARILELPYIPFRLWFSDGQIRFGEGGDDDLQYRQHSMLPVWFSVGDHDNIVGFRHLGDKHPYSFDANFSLCQGGFERCNSFYSNDEESLHVPGTTLKPVSDPTDEPGELFIDPDTAFFGESDAVAAFALRVALAKPSNPGIFETVFHFGWAVIPFDFVVLPGGDDCKQPGAKGAPFHYDSRGKTCFTAAEAELAGELFSKHDIMQRVKTGLHTVPFVLPQTAANASNYFCNESVYVSTEIMCVSGVIRMAS